MALGLSTRKALSILKEQLEAVLEGHLKERKRCLTWKVGQSPAGVAEQPGPSSGPGLPLCPGGATPPGLTENQKGSGVPFAGAWPLLLPDPS